MQGVIELALQMPRKLRVVQISRMNRKNVGMHWNTRILQVNQNFDNAALRFARGKCQQRMFVAPKVLKHSGKIRGVRHPAILLSWTLG